MSLGRFATGRESHEGPDRACHGECRGRMAQRWLDASVRETRGCGT